MSQRGDVNGSRVVTNSLIDKSTEQKRWIQQAIMQRPRKTFYTKLRPHAFMYVIVLLIPHFGGLFQHFLSSCTAHINKFNLGVVIYAAASGKWYSLQLVNTFGPPTRPLPTSQPLRVCIFSMKSFIHSGCHRIGWRGEIPVVVVCC